MIRVTNNPTGRPAYSWKDLKRAGGDKQFAAQQSFQRQLLEQQQRALSGSAISTGLRDFGDPAFRALQSAPGLSQGQPTGAANQPIMQPGVEPGMATLSVGQPVARPGQQEFIPGSATNPAVSRNPRGARQDLIAGMVTNPPGSGAPGQSLGMPARSAAVAADNRRSLAQTGMPFGPTQYGLGGAENAYSRALMGSLAAYNDANQQGRADLMQAGAGANQTLSRFYSPGQEANQYQAALSGALGGDAQAAAFDRFMESPGQQYLRQESERAILRNAAATGGLGGGNVLRALQENAIGLAAQDFDRSFNRLGSLSDRGLAAGGQIAGNTMQTGRSLASLGADMGARMGSTISGTGDAIAASRSQAGRDIASNAQQVAGGLAALRNNTGRDISNVIGVSGGNLANLLAGAGRDELAQRQAYATLLANLASGNASNIAGLPSLGTTQQTRGALGSVGDFLSGVGSIMGPGPGPA